MVKQIFEQTSFNGNKTTWHLSGGSATEVAASAALYGWTAPRWWQWWRANDQPRKAVLSAATACGKPGDWLHP